jgi:hypothetical protein
MLARPYPQYGDLTVIDGVSGGDIFYHSLQIKGSKSFSIGDTLWVAYSYHVQTNQQFYDKVDDYLKRWTSDDSGARPPPVDGSGTWADPVVRAASSCPAHPDCSTP